MNYTDLLYDLLKKYIEYIIAGNDALVKEYKFEGSPLFAKRQKKIPQTGIAESNFGVMNFRFHGDGCEFNFGNIIVNFDYHYGDNTYRMFGSWDFYSFLSSIPLVPEELKSHEIIRLYLPKLVSCGYIKRAHPLYEIFEVLY